MVGLKFNIAIRNLSINIFCCSVFGVNKAYKNFFGIKTVGQGNANSYFAVRLNLFVVFIRRNVKNLSLYSAVRITDNFKCAAVVGLCGNLNGCVLVKFFVIDNFNACLFICRNTELICCALFCIFAFGANSLLLSVLRCCGFFNYFPLSESVTGGL